MCLTKSLANLKIFILEYSEINFKPFINTEDGQIFVKLFNIIIYFVGIHAKLNLHSPNDFIC